MKKNKILKYILLMIIIISISYCLSKVFITVKDNTNTEKEIKEIKKHINEIKESEEQIIEPQPQENQNKKEELTLNFKKLKEINNDTVAWIKITNTNIDYPVVKSNNNTYYLNHSFYKEENNNGWIFENSDNSSNFDDKNTILFGHNTNSTTMFSQLKDIYKGTLGNNITIIIYTENTIKYYKVFSIYLENPNQTKAINKYINKEIIDEIKQKSKINFNIEVNESDKILTLSTCNNITNDRILLHSKQILE